MSTITIERERISNEAIVWFLRLRHDHSEDADTKFLDWLTQSAEHVEVFLLATALIAEIESRERGDPP
jgi:ferric-dicitrate binding protein FerR (iron transport regulator)